MPGMGGMGMELEGQVEGVKAKMQLCVPSTDVDHPLQSPVDEGCTSRLVRKSRPFPP